MNNHPNEKRSLFRLPDRFRNYKNRPLACMLVLISCLGIMLVLRQGLLKVNTHDNLAEYLDVESTPVPSVTSILDTLTPSPEPLHLIFHGDVYQHPQGLFELPLPEGWIVASEQDGAVEFTNPSVGISLHIQVTNTGQELDKSSFEKFVEAQEVNLFSAYPGYIEIERKFDQVDNTASVVKHLLLNDENQQVLSLYQQSGESILNLNIWSKAPLPLETSNEFLSFFMKIRLFSDNISAQPVYRWVYEFLSSQRNYTGLVPLQWEHQQTSTDTTQIDCFVAPSQEVMFQLIQYNDGKWINKKDAGFITLQLLREKYEPDITIIENWVEPNGREFMEWRTIEKGVSGSTLFEVVNKTLTIMTWTYPTAEEKIYEDLLQTISDSIHAIE